MSDTAAKEEKGAAAEEAPLEQRRIRDIQKRDLMVVRHLTSDYPGFFDLGAEDQLDRIVLVLESICGFGAVSVETIGQLNSVFKCDVKDIALYFQTNQYDNPQTGGKKNKYRESFEGAFCLEREFKKNLSEEGEETNSNEPIRKKVPPKAGTHEANVKKMQSPHSLGPKLATSLSALESTSMSSGQNLDTNNRLSTGHVDKSEESIKKSPMSVIVGLAVAIVLVLVVVALVIGS